MDELISRQAAIDALGKESDAIFRTKEKGATFPDRAWFDGMAYAESVIRNLPSAQPEYRLDEWCTDCKEYDTEKHCCPRFNKVIRTTLDEMEPERKRGKWKLLKNGSAICSECGFTQMNTWDLDNWDNFCHHCGADMRGDHHVD